MEIFLKVFVSGVVSSFVFGMIGGIAGTFLSGVIAFPDIGHAAGYESGGMIVGTISMVLGGILGSWFVLPQLYKRHQCCHSGDHSLHYRPSCDTDADCAITRTIRSRITSNFAPISRSPRKILGEKLFVITSHRPCTENNFVYVELFY